MRNEDFQSFPLRLVSGEWSWTIYMLYISMRATVSLCPSLFIVIGCVYVCASLV